MDVKTTFRNLVRDQSVSICMLQYSCKHGNEVTVNILSWPVWDQIPACLWDGLLYVKFVGFDQFGAFVVVVVLFKIPFSDSE